MRSYLKFAVTAIALMTILGACTGVPGATEPASTQPAATTAPAATVALQPTEASQSADATSPVEATNAPQSAATAESTTAPTVAIATAEPSPSEPALTRTSTAAPVVTTAPEPTMPPAPTAAAASIACTPGALTPAQTEGPYYKENPPEAASLLQPGMSGTKVKITGYVLDEQCRPVPGARVDFWQADAEGQYDNQGYTLRGYQLTDAEGRYSLETVLPGLYPGRTRHIHLKVTPPSGPTLTSQLYFPDEAANAADRIFSPELVVNLETTADGETGTFNFVVATQQ